MVKKEREKRNILSHENINTFLAVSAAIMAVSSLPFEKNHIIYSLSHGEITYNKSEEAGFNSVAIPINIKIQNLSDGPIKIVDTFIGFDKNRDGSCDEWMRMETPFSVENNGYIEQGGLANHEDSLVVPADRKEAEICLYSAWRNQNGYQRVYLESAGQMGWQMMPSSGDQVGVFQHQHIRLGDIINVFGPSRCVSLFGEEYCL